MNPPYRKISSASDERKQLRKVGIETVNLYSGFVALALLLLKPHGELVAIIPRSFCNGPYYRSFRNFIMKHAALRRLHLFNSRTSVFNADKVLQENVIIHLERDGEQQDVKVSSSTDQSLSDLEAGVHSVEDVVDTFSDQFFFKFPGKGRQALYNGIHVGSPLPVDVSTGPVVDFRMREHLHKTPHPGDAPLLYPAHFNSGFLWPRQNFKKYNSIIVSSATMRCLYLKGWYVVIRRLSSKEEKKRIVAQIVNPDSFPDSKYLAFENHLNVFHNGRKGLETNVAYGLAAYLNLKAVDMAFRTFNGHTQVNATDLRSLIYPPLAQLAALGEKVRTMPKERAEEWIMKMLS